MMIARTLSGLPVTLGAGLLALHCGGAAGNAQASGEWGPQSEGFQLRAELQTAQTRPVVPVTVRCTLRNVSGEDLALWVAQPEVNYNLAVTHESGEVIDPTGLEIDRAMKKLPAEIKARNPMTKAVIR